MTWWQSFLGGFRWWLLALIGALCVTVQAYAWLSPRVDEAFRKPMATYAMLGTAVLVLGWFLFLSRYRWQTRLIVVSALVAPVVALRLSVRMDGFDGDNVPRYSWRWNPKHDYALVDAPPSVSIQDDSPVDLAATTPDDFPQFLGPEGRNAVTGVKLERDWTSHPPREVWRQPIGAGWGAFAVVGPFAVTQEQRGPAELVTCYEVATGRLRWSHTDDARFSESMGGDGPRATPTIVDGKVYAMGATGLLHCLDGATGRVVWTRDVLDDKGTRIPNLIWGKSCSPLVVDGLVVVTLGDRTLSLAAFDMLSGQPAWIDAQDDKPSYASPIVATLAGRRQIVSVNAETVTGHDIVTGKLLWRVPFPGDFAKCSQPVLVGEDRVFVSAGYGVGCALIQVKTDSDDRWEAVELWRQPQMRTRFTNVALREGHVYGLDDGILACVDLESGKRLWHKGRYGHGQVLLVDDLLLVQAEPGGVFLTKVAPAGHQELGQLAALSDKTWNNPVIAGQWLLVRNDREAACYDIRPNFN